MAVVPKVRLEMTARRSDTTTLAWLAESPSTTTILVGEKTRLPPLAVARQLVHALVATTDRGCRRGAYDTDHPCEGSHRRRSGRHTWLCVAEPRLTSDDRFVTCKSQNPQIRER
jgi:hypothetical protein